MIQHVVMKPCNQNRYMQHIDLYKENHQVCFHLLADEENPFFLKCLLMTNFTFERLFTFMNCFKVSILSYKTAPLAMLTSYKTAPLAMFSSYKTAHQPNNPLQNSPSAIITYKIVPQFTLTSHKTGPWPTKRPLSTPNYWSREVIFLAPKTCYTSF